MASLVLQSPKGLGKCDRNSKVMTDHIIGAIILDSFYYEGIKTIRMCMDHSYEIVWSNDTALRVGGWGVKFPEIYVTLESPYWESYGTA